MRLDRLVNAVDVFDRPREARKTEITFITDDTRQVVPGTLFCCVRGVSHDGHDFAQQAINAGAVALVVEHELDLPVPQIRVTDVRASMAPIASEFYDHPDRHLRIVGITGTNGKTTTSQILAGILQQHRWQTSTIGTLSGQYTSPPALELQRKLAEFRDRHDHAVVMETSSHALEQHRLDAVHFTVGVFTNLTQDHLDYHRTMNRYFEAKAMLFDPGRCEKAIINIDDEWGRRLVDRVAIPVTEYSLADAVDLEIGTAGSSFVWQGQQVKLPLIGKFNVYNALAGATAARAMGVPVEQIASALSATPSVRGRVEKVDRGQPFTVIVDFAHTPDGLEGILNVARAAAQPKNGRVIVVFGCGGDRDAEKRPQMGAIAQQLADVVIVTSDNPRSEDPQLIAEQIVHGMHDSSAVDIETDRAVAISRAARSAHGGDVVVIAGKGHETTQEINGVKTPFDDVLVAKDALDAMRRSLEA